MFMRHRSLTVGLLLVMHTLGTGCAQMTQAEIKFLETRELDLPYDEAYSAAANGLFSLGYSIEHSDKESGILSGRRHDPNTGGKLASGLFFGIVGLLATGENDEAVTFMLTRYQSAVTILRMKVIVNGQQIVDHKIMTRIWQQIEREAMLDTRPLEDKTTEQSSTEKPPQPTKKGSGG